MKIVLTGVETNNKGAELMLYAILQEIERKYPEAEVFLSRSRIQQGFQYIETKLDFKCFPYEEIERKLHLGGIYERLNIPIKFLPHVMAIGKVDYYIDGSGFRFSDQFVFSNREISFFNHSLRTISKTAKIIFMPQAFGPFKKKESQKILSVLNQYANLIMPREQVSYDYLKDSGLVDMLKVRKYTDFTSLVDGTFPSEHEHLKKGLCIIPNMKMIEKGGMTFDEYAQVIASIVKEGKKVNIPIYLLNHEGSKDAVLCHKFKDLMKGDIEVVTGLNALSVKGLISSAYMVITSRFHGLASALNSGVPSLATSWSHKYEELLKDYGLDSNYLLPLNDTNAALQKVRKLLEPQENHRVRTVIENKVPEIKTQTSEMWKTVWEQ